MKAKVSKKYYKVAPEENNKCHKTYAYVCVKSTDTTNSKGVHHKGKTTKTYFTPTAIDKGIKITKEEFLIEYNKAKTLKKKKGKLTIVVPKRYEDLFKDVIWLPYHFLLIHSLGNVDWITDKLKKGFNIKLYTDKNDTELFKKSFGKFEVKLMDKEVLVSGWYKTSLEPESSKWLMYHDFESGKRFGFDSYGNWINDTNANILLGTLVKSDIKEVEERLKKEAVKRGFNIDSKFKSFDDCIYPAILNEFSFDVEKNVFYYSGIQIMRDGKWVEIVEEKLTLENIQVDCSELTSEQIENMKRVVVESWYELWDDECAFTVSDYGDHFYLSVDVFCILTKMDSLTTITYDKFIKLFDTKIEDSKPKQYQIGIDTFERAKANLTKEEYLACLKFNIDKYLWRLKGQDIEDFKKIIAYANEAINVLESKK